MIETIAQLIEALQAFEGDQSVKILVNGDEDVTYEIVKVESDGSGGVLVTVL